MSKPKKEYREREADEEGTPFQRFENMVRRVIAVPKSEIEERERDWKRRRDSSQ